MSDLRARTLEGADITAVLPLLNAAYGANPTFESRLRRYRALQPDGWVLVQGGDRPLGMGGFVRFGDCAYVGLMAVAPSAQRRGIGAFVFDEVIARCEAQGVRLFVLDASAPGAPLYEKRGFVDHGTARFFSIDPERLPPEPSAGVRIDAIDDEASLTAVAAFDAQSFGADRARLIRLLVAAAPERALVARDGAGNIVGYAVAQPRTFGPCAADSPDVATALAHRALRFRYESKPGCYVIAENESALGVVRALGGVETRSWRHMRRGAAEALASDWSRIYAKTSLALG